MVGAQHTCGFSLHNKQKLVKKLDPDRRIVSTENGVRSSATDLKRKRMKWGRLE